MPLDEALQFSHDSVVQILQEYQRSCEVVAKKGGLNLGSSAWQ